MKKLLLITIASLFCLSGIGQEPELVDNDWFLHDLIIDGEHNIPYNTGVDFIIDFYEFEGEDFIGYDATSLNTVWIDYITGEQKFEITDLIGLAKDVCYGGSKACIIYQNIYQPFYESQIGAILDYEIETGTGGASTLTVTRPDGNQAIYRTVILSSREFVANNFKIYPNPTTDALFLHTENQTIKELTIYSVSGNKVMQPAVMDQHIDVSLLPTGLYFLEIRTENGSTIERFIKE